MRDVNHFYLRVILSLGIKCSWDTTFVTGMGKHDVNLFLKDKENVGDAFCYEATNCVTFFKELQAKTQDKWEGLCQEGMKQSPINILTSDVSATKSITWSFFWHYDMAHGLNPIHLDGHTVMIDGTKLHVMSLTLIDGENRVAYRLLDIQFHWGASPSEKGSEHFIDGKQFDVEVQFIHLNQKVKTTSDLKNVQGTPFFVISLFFEAVEGIKAPSLQPIFDAIKNFAVDRTTTFRTKTVPLNFFKIFPEDRSKLRYYSYKGSYTSPDCEETVQWAVVKEPIKISPKQLEGFWNLKNDGEFIKNNFRKVHPLNGRKITEYAPKIQVVGADINNRAVPLFKYRYFTIVVSIIVVILQ